MKHFILPLFIILFSLPAMAAINLQALGACEEEDATTTINTALAQAKAIGTSVYAPACKYNHSGVIIIDSTQLYGEKGTVFNSANVTGVNPDNAIILTGSNPKLLNVEITTDWTGLRQSNINGHAVVVSSANDFLVENIDVLGSAGSGIFITNSYNGLTTYNKVKDTLADGIHITNKSYNNIISGNHIIDTGDDQIAVVSYNSDAGISHDILINGNIVSGGSTRGISVVGGERITITDNNISDIDLSGVYIATESSYNTNYVKDILVGNNFITSCNTDNSSGASSVYVFGRDGYTTSNIIISNNQVLKSVRNGITVASESGIPAYSNHIKIIGNLIEGDLTSLDSGIGIKFYGADSIDVINNTIRDFHAGGVYSDSGTMSGVINVFTNRFENLNAGATSWVDAVYFSTGASIINFQGNIQLNGSYTVQRFLEVNQAVSVIFENNYGENVSVSINRMTIQ